MTKENKHLTKELLEAFHQDNLNTDDYVLLLEHVSNCTSCSDLFANSFTDQKQLSAPPNLKQEILSKASKKNKLVLPQWMKPSPKRQLFFYSLRVCTAMCGALLFILIEFSDLDKLSDYSKIPAFDFTIVDSINSNMKEVSNGINKLMNSFVSLNKQTKQSKKLEDMNYD